MLFDPQEGALNPFTISTDHVVFHDDGSLSITYLGVKNDSTGTGFQMTVPKCSVPKLDPGGALRSYIHATAFTPPGPNTSSPLLLSLRPPYIAIKASTVGAVLEEAIALSGLAGKGYTAKSFRPTGATLCAKHGDAMQVMQLGQWKTQEVFYNHYVHSWTPQDYCDNLFNVQSSG